VTGPRPAVVYGKVLLPASTGAIWANFLEANAIQPVPGTGDRHQPGGAATRGAAGGRLAPPGDGWSSSTTGHPRA